MLEVPADTQHSDRIRHTALLLRYSHNEAFCVGTFVHYIAISSRWYLHLAHTYSTDAAQNAWSILSNLRSCFHYLHVAFRYKCR